MTPTALRSRPGSKRKQHVDQGQVYVTGKRLVERGLLTRSKPPTRSAVATTRSKSTRRPRKARRRIADSIAAYDALALFAASQGQRTDTMPGTHMPSASDLDQSLSGHRRPRRCRRPRRIPRHGDDDRRPARPPSRQRRRRRLSGTRDQLAHRHRRRRRSRENDMQRAGEALSVIDPVSLRRPRLAPRVLPWRVRCREAPPGSDLGRARRLESSAAVRGLAAWRESASSPSGFALIALAAAHRLLVHRWSGVFGIEPGGACRHTRRQP